MTKGTGCKGKYPFLDLQHHDPVLQTVPDTVIDAIVNLYDLVTGRDDTEKCRNSEYKLGRLSATVLKKKISRKDPEVSYSLSLFGIQLANTGH